MLNCNEVHYISSYVLIEEQLSLELGLTLHCGTRGQGGRIYATMCRI